MADPIISYFGQHPTTILLETTDGFSGTAQTGTPELSPGLYKFPPQSGGGLFDFHDDVIDIKNITFKGSGNLLIKKVLKSGTEAEIAKITSGEGEFFENTTLSPSEAIKFICTGPAVVSITSSLTKCFWAT